MDFERLSGDLKELRRRNRTLGAAVGLLAAGHVLALAVVLNLLVSCPVSSWH
jgi:conjugal transfer pilus assembly protein TraE